MNRVGRPLKFQNLEELKDRIESYFTTTKIELWTITGLALHLDTCRFTLCNYADGEGERAEFIDTIKKAKLRVEHAYELRGMEKGTSFDIFRLKNMGWTDRQDHDLTSKGEALQVQTIPQSIAAKNDIPVSPEPTDASGVQQ